VMSWWAVPAVAAVSKGVDRATSIFSRVPGM
jgi:hypothetical protein